MSVMPQTPARSHEQASVEAFQADPDYAAAFFSAVLEDGDQQEVMIALRRMTQAFGGVPKLAEQTDLNATTLYRTLSPQGNPEMKTLTAILKSARSLGGRRRRSENWPQ